MAKPDSQALLTTQKNSLFLAIRSRGFSPSDFTCGDDADGALVKYRDTRYAFSIIISEDSFRDETSYLISISPGRKFFKEDSRRNTWAEVLAVFNYWLDCLTSQLETPDLWATVSDATQLISLVTDQDNQPFTQHEQLQVKQALNEIKTYLIQSQMLTDEQTRTVEARFDYMEEAASRLGRKDWMGILVSSLIGIVSTLSLSADSTKDLFRFAGQIVKQLLGTILYLTGPH
jgi:hypothetical protein